MIQLEINELKRLRFALLRLQSHKSSKEVRDAILKLDKVINRMDATRKRLI